MKPRGNHGTHRQAPPAAEPTCLSSDGYRYGIPDEDRCKEIELLVYATIQELAFAAHHACDGEVGEAEQCLMTAGSNIDRLGQELEQSRVKEEQHES